MVTQIIGAVLMILAAVGLLFIAWFANFIASLFNIKLVSDIHFDRERFFMGIIRLLTIISVSVLLAILLTMIPIVCNYYGATIPEAFVNTYNIVIIFLSFVQATIKYFIQAYHKLNKVINNGFIDEDAVAEIVETATADEDTQI